MAGRYEVRRWKYKGKTWTMRELIEIAKAHGVGHGTLKNRLYQLEWGVTRAVETPPNKKMSTRIFPKK